MEYLREIGPDTMVPCFSINLKGNEDVNLVNDIVQAVFKDLCMSDDRVSAYRYPMLVTASTFKHHNHSVALKEFKKRLGVCCKSTANYTLHVNCCRKNTFLVVFSGCFWFNCASDRFVWLVRFFMQLCVRLVCLVGWFNCALDWLGWLVGLV